MKRREFLIRSFVLGSYLLSGCSFKGDLHTDTSEKGNTGDTMERDENQGKVSEGEPNIRKTSNKVYIIETNRREEGIRELIRRFNLRKTDRGVVIKANYNSADPFPASTHIDTLSTILDVLSDVNPNIILAERSGMGDTEHVLERRGVKKLTEKGLRIVNLDSYNSWVKFKADHWKNGFLIADVFTERHVVQTCCLKTHRFGGHFTMSLKNSVGMVARNYNGYDYMAELHSSLHMRKMIAEINIAYSPILIIMDAIKGFSKGGPESGEIISPNLLIAGEDRVAIDSVGVALLRIYGTTTEVSKGRIFEQEQISRAVELGIGVSSPEEIELIPLNPKAERICDAVRKLLTD